jgi:exo-beta-1,3-glucanase (GH17 family)
MKLCHAHRHVARRTVHQRYAFRRAFVKVRERLTIIDPSYASPTEIPEVVVYVDEFANPIRTATETVVYIPSISSSIAPFSTAASDPPPPGVTESVSVPHSMESAGSEGTTAAVPQTANSPAPVPLLPPPPPLAPENPQSISSAIPVPSTGSERNLHGITYSPYKGTGGCKSAAEVDADFAVFGSDYGIVRLYGVDCDQVASAYAAAKKYGNKLFIGIFDISSVDSAVATLASGVHNDWSVVDTVSIGNELVNNGAMSPSQVLDAVKQARTALQGAGYQGPVVTVDTFVAVINNPELCDQSDYCAVNIHPFFDPNTSADQAGSFVASQLENVRSKLADSSKRVVVTETGWPWKGVSNGAAVPSLNNQANAISSIKSAFSDNPTDCILFTAFNDLWKKPAADTFMAEQFWGMEGRFSVSDA